MPDHFVDTNILLRHLLADHPDHSPRATDYLARIEAGEIREHLADTIVFETVFMLERRYKAHKDEIREVLLQLIELPGMILPGKRRFRLVFDYYVDLNISFADAYHAALMDSLDIEEVVSFDQHFDRVPGIKRIEP